MSAQTNQPSEPVSKEYTFRQELTGLINKHNLEQHCNTPDYIIAEYLVNCFNSYCEVKNHNDVWHGIGKDNAI